MRLEETACELEKQAQPRPRHRPTTIARHDDTSSPGKVRVAA